VDRCLWHYQVKPAELPRGFSGWEPAIQVSGNSSVGGCWLPPLILLNVGDLGSICVTKAALPPSEVSWAQSGNFRISDTH
jgi:hypothetical protein